MASLLHGINLSVKKKKKEVQSEMASREESIVVDIQRNREEQRKPERELSAASEDVSNVEIL